MDDCPRIAEIHVFGWRHAYREFISPDYLFSKMTVKNSENKFREYLGAETGTSETFVYENGNIIKGFMTIGNSRDEDKNSETFELHGIYVDPLFQGKGVGTELVNFCTARAKKQNRTEIILWVFKKNENTKKFYKKTGFMPDGKSKILETFNEKAVRYIKKIE